jgi:hypothetical protein
LGRARFRSMKRTFTIDWSGRMDPEPRIRLFRAVSLLVPAFVYFFTMSRDIGPIDSGELAAVCADLGIAHPTGYPLYVLMGRLAILVSSVATPIIRLNLLSAALASVSSLFAFDLFLMLTREVESRVSIQRGSSGPSEIASEIVALGAAWLWAFHPALWSQATGNEVHALQAALVLAILLASQSSRCRGQDLSLIVIVAYLTGIAFTNHLSVVYLVPGLVAGFAIDPAYRRLLWNPRNPALIGLAFLVPLALYAYLPVRAAHHPSLDWGNPGTFSRFFRHIGGAQYRVWMFTSGASFRSNLCSFAHEFASPTGIVMVAAAIAGIARLSRTDRPTLFRLGLGFAVGTAWASGYEIHDIEPYYMIPRISLACLAVAGAAFLVSLLRRQRWIPLATIAPVAALILCGIRFSSYSRRADHFVRFYTENLLDRLPPNSILISRHWDMVVSPLLYIQLVDKERLDVIVVDPELLRRSWYYAELRRADPALLAPIEDRVTAFMEQLRLFEANRPYDPILIEERYRDVIRGIFEAHRAERPIFHTPDVDPIFYGDWYGVPEALAVRMVRHPAEAPMAVPCDPAVWLSQARYANEPVRRVAWSFLIELGAARIRFLEGMGRAEEAAEWRNAIASFQSIGTPPLRGGR